MAIWLSVLMIFMVPVLTKSVNGVEQAMIRDALIRMAHPGDARAIAGIHVDSWRAAYAGILPKSYLRNLRYDRTAKVIFDGMLDRTSVFLIAEDRQGHPIGYIWGGPERSGHALFQCEVYELYIAPGYQRQGMGRILLSALAKRLYRSGGYSLMVWVLAKNPNRRFYAKAGGLLSGTKTIAFADKKLQAVAYGWVDMTLAITV